MAITGLEFSVLRWLHERNLLPQGGDILQIGENNWYGDVPWLELSAVFPGGTPVGGIATDEFSLARNVLCSFFGVDHDTITAIDLNGTARAFQFDLNKRLLMQWAHVKYSKATLFSAVLDFGTSEHVFDIAQVYRTIHEHTAPNGLMIHSCPFTGWIDHGFYSIHPTLYYDLAAANEYDVVGMWYGKLTPLWMVKLEDRDHMVRLVKDNAVGRNGLICAVLRKRTNEPFRVPMQGHYAGTTSSSAREAWKSQR
jgi:hypothetical protein